VLLVEDLMAFEESFQVLKVIFGVYDFYWCSNENVVNFFVNGSYKPHHG